MHNLFFFYSSLVGLPLLGYIIRQLAPRAIIFYSHQFITWIAIPSLVLTSVTYHDLYPNFWLAPLVALVTVLVSTIFTLITIDLDKIDEKIRLLWRSHRLSNVSTNAAMSHQLQIIHNSHHKKLVHTVWTDGMQASFLMFGLMGNTNYIAFAIISLILLSSHWLGSLTHVVLFDIFSYIFGILTFISIIKIRHNIEQQIEIHPHRINKQLIINIFKEVKVYLLKNQIFCNIVISFAAGILISFFIDLISLINTNNQQNNFLGFINLASLTNIILRAKTLIVYIYLLCLGIQFSSVKHKFLFKSIFMCLLNRALVLPIIMAALLIMCDVSPWLMIPFLIQVNMPCRFSDLQLQKTYKLVPEFINSSNSIGSILLIFTIPIWVSLYYL
jgi:predicted permease